MRLFVTDPESGPIQGVVIKMTGPGGGVFYTRETDSHGYGEVLVPVGQRYEMEYLSLGRRNTTAAVEVPEGRNQDIRLTLRYRRFRGEAGRVVLDGVLFETNRAIIQSSSFPRLDRVIEYLRHRPLVRIRIAGHTDNVGNPRRNQRLSEQRANAVRDYIVAHGIEGSRVEAVGLGDQEPVATNDTEEGRQQNRRIEATEL
jgi:outer membrane protein OmpA-like peptidoglycan-associated protein